MADAFLRSPVLNVKNLTVAYLHRSERQVAVRDATFQIEAGETFGLVGESGSGKTTLALAVIGWLGDHASVLGGQVELSGRNLLGLDLHALQKVRGRQVGFVPQNPQSSLNPALRIGEQLAEPLQLHLGISGRSARERVFELLERVQIAGPRRVAESYPHQISGGMQQRIMIAMAVAASPALLVLDEPTSNLDVTTQAAILDLIQNLTQDRQTAILYVTHDLAVVANICNRVAVMYAGELVEQAAASDLFTAPRHPYTVGLLESVPRLGANHRKAVLRSIEGHVPPLGERPSGCVFRTRCPLAAEICLERPPLYPVEPGHISRCHRWEDVPLLQGGLEQPEEDYPPQNLDRIQAEKVLELDNLQVHFPMHRSLAGLVSRTPPQTVKALNGVTLSLERGRNLGLVGESGSGKTTLARAVMGLTPKTGGEMLFLQKPLPTVLSERSREVMQRLQMVFQNPEEAFNPFATLGESLLRPLRSLAGMPNRAANQEVERLLEAVHLPAQYAGRLPGQLSGGEKQRAAVARAIAAHPTLLVCDEPVSSLDVSVQAAILNLLAGLQAGHGVDMLFISHNLAVVGYLADKIAVIYLGFLMEVSESQDLFKPPFHPYTEALLAAVPVVGPAASRSATRLRGEVPSPTRIPSGCPFHPRCPRFLGQICVEQTPPWQTYRQGGQQYWCHIPPDELLQIQQHPANLGDGP